MWFDGIHDEHADNLCPGQQEAVEAVRVRGGNDFAGLPPAPWVKSLDAAKGESTVRPLGASQTCRI